MKARNGGKGMTDEQVERFVSPLVGHPLVYADATRADS